MPIIHSINLYNILLLIKGHKRLDYSKFGTPYGALSKAYLVANDTPEYTSYLLSTKVYKKSLILGPKQEYFKIYLKFIDIFMGGNNHSKIEQEKNCLA